MGNRIEGGWIGRQRKTRVAGGTSEEEEIWTGLTLMVVADGHGVVREDCHSKHLLGSRGEC